MYENLNLSTLTPSEYGQWLKNEIKEGRRSDSELNSVHVLQTKYDVKRNSGTVKPEVVAHHRVQIYGKKEWETVQQDYLQRAGYEVKVLWPYTEPKAKVKGPEVPQVPDGTPDPEPAPAVEAEAEPAAKPEKEAKPSKKEAKKSKKKNEDKINLG